MRLKKSIATAVVALTTLAASMSFSSPQANALLPTGCNFWETHSEDYTRAACQNLRGGSYRAIAVCWKSSTAKVWRYGPWLKGGYSFAYCQGSEDLAYGGVESRPT